METTNIMRVLGILAFAIVVVILLLRFMRARHVADARRAADTPPLPPSTMTKEEEEYLDSSHIGGPILPGGGEVPSRGNKRK